MSIKYNGGYIPAVGADGTTLVANSSASTGVSWAGPTFTAGKNKIINGDFGIWQRGTTGSSTTFGLFVGADRFNYGTIGTATTISQQTFTPGTAPVAGYESVYYSRTTCGASTTYIDIGQKIENVQTFAGQTATVSFWAKSSASLVMTPSLYQNFGTSGSTTVTTSGSNITLTSSWVRYTVTFTVPSISGKTIGAGSNLGFYLTYVSGTLATTTFDTWGWQLEAGSVATPFTTATGTLSGELAACQRYYYRTTSGSAYGFFAQGFVNNASTTNASVAMSLPVTMRVIPTAVDYSNTAVLDSSFSGSSCSLGIETTESTTNAVRLTAIGSGMTANRTVFVRANNNTAAYVGFTSEL